MFCTNCGKKAPDGSKFCPACGTPLYREEEQLPAKEQTPIVEPSPKPEPTSEIENTEENQGISTLPQIKEGIKEETTSTSNITASSDSVEDVVGKNIIYYLNEFKKVDEGQKTKFNWAAFLLGPFFCFYRKCGELFKEYFLIPVGILIFSLIVTTIASNSFSLSMTVVGGILSAIGAIWSFINYIRFGKNFNKDYYGHCKTMLWIGNKKRYGTSVGSALIAVVILSVILSIISTLGSSTDSDDNSTLSPSELLLDGKASESTERIDTTSNSDKQSNQSNSRPANISNASDYIGEWGDTYSQRYFMTITDFGFAYFIKISWYGTSYDSQWSIMAQYNDSTGELEYSNGTKFNHIYTSDGNVVEDLFYEDGVGKFYFSDGYLHWQDNIEHIGDSCLFEKDFYEIEFRSDENISEFMQKLTAEQNTQSYMSFNQLIRNPNQFNDGRMYRFTGYISSIDRNESSSAATFQVEDTIIVIYYPGWIDALQGDMLTIYGYVNGISQYNSSTQGTVQTAGVDIVYYTIGSGLVDCELTEEQWDFITGDWYSNDSDRYIESTVTITKNTINGRPYTIKRIGIGSSNILFNYASENLLSGQELYLNYIGEAANGETINGTFFFNFDGRMSHTVLPGEVLYEVEFHR